MWMDPAQGRWVCPRCFESNEADADRCAGCGLERGADPAVAQAAAAAPGAPPAEPARKAQQPAPAAPAGPWTAAPQPEPDRPGWLQLVLRFWWVGLLVIGGGIAAVSYLGGSRPVTDIDVGECFDLADPEARSSTTSPSGCTEAHAYEMYFVGNLPDGPYPSEAEVDLWLEGQLRPGLQRVCRDRLRELGSLRTSITPTEDGWNDGDHSVQCARVTRTTPS